MGDPISPAMAISACAWMEDVWMKALPADTKGRFMAKRFMDDILIVLAKSTEWDYDGFIRDFTKSTCYQEPLKLEEGKDGTFLETRFEIKQNTVRYKLKNDNEMENKIWRYQHYLSYAPFLQKRATLTACLKKVQQHASDRDNLYASALNKIAEFRDLGYPLDVLKKACLFLGATSGEAMWLTVRRALR